MAKIVMVCYRKKHQESELIRKIKLLSNKLIPDNINPTQTKVIKNDNIIFGIYNPNDSFTLKDNRSVYLGSLFEKTNWWDPEKNYPDGSYVLFRSDEEYIEILTDVVASRTIWYYKDNEIFIASTSQRAIIYLLGSFIFNDEVIPWMLSAGNLGPGYSWDKRIKCLPGDASLTLKRSTWFITLKKNEFGFSELNVPDKEHYKLMKDAIEKTFNSIKIDYSKWVIPLSGGYDSRYILSLLKDKAGISTVTWGSKEARLQKGNDAYIAKLLAEYYGVDNKFFELDINLEIDKVLNYFITCGEGRTDCLFGYTDGFEMWKTLFENDVKGIIRGDVCFSTQKVKSLFDVRYKLEFPLCCDFSNLDNYKEFGFAQQEWPDNLKKKHVETLESWRDRIYQQMRIPTILSALSDLKLPYVEIVNPFLSKGIIYQSRRLPYHLRTNKKLFKELVRLNDTSGIEYARYDSYTNLKNILKRNSTVEFLKDELSSIHANSLIPEDFLKYVISHMTIIKKNGIDKGLSLKNMVRPFIPYWFKDKLLDNAFRIKKPMLDFNTLAFRVYIIYRMNKIFNADCH
jgi:hypothetical protein